MSKSCLQRRVRKGVWLRTLIVVLGVTVLSACDSYQVTVYPNKDNLTNHVTIEGLDSLESCRNTAKKMILEKGYANPDYECGINCKKEVDVYGDLYICEDTTR